MLRRLLKTTAYRAFRPSSHKFTTWILHESEAYIYKALKGKTIVAYVETLIFMQDSDNIFKETTICLPKY